MSNVESVLELERKFWESSDSRVYRESMSDQAVIVMEPMGFLTKDKAVEMADSGQTGFTDVQLQDVRAVEVDSDCVAIAYHGEGTSRQGKRQRSSVASTYARQDGHWRLVMTSHQPWPEPKAGS